MNGRAAKRLRELAQGLTVGQPKVLYEHFMLGTSPTGTVVMGECTRRTYKRLKKWHKLGGDIVGLEESSKGVREAV